MKENSTTNSLVSDTMAAKICPICEIFTSSSSTTLKSHVDQCLSGVSMITWKAKSKASKHRIEQRKMRSMVDIYASAPYCTLEELDRRNGTNWALNSSLPAEERKQEAPINFEDKENEDSRYLDAYGAKLRTLSKCTDQSSPEKIGEPPVPRRLVKRDQGRKFLLMNEKKKKHGKKQHKLQKCAIDSKKLSSPGNQHKSEIIGGQEQETASEEICEKEEAFRQHCRTRDQAKFNDGQNGTKKKLNVKDDLQISACTNKESRGVKNESSLGNSYNVKRGRLLRSPMSSGNPPSPPKINNNALSKPNHEDREEVILRKRVRVSLMESEACNKANPISSSSSPRNEMKRVLTRNSDSGVKSKHFSSKSKRLSSLKKKLVSISQASVPGSKFSLKRICLPHQKTRSEKKCDKANVFKNTMLKVRKDKGESKILKKDEAMVLKGSKLALGYREHDDDGNVDLAPGNFVSESASGMVDEEALMRIHLDGGFHVVAGFSDVQSDSRKFLKVLEGPFLGTEYSRCPVEPIISDGQNKLCTGGGENVHVRTKLDSTDDGPGHYNIEVDSITIPGPPGSFLPSPCRMTSGNSSLTSSLVQSSEDHPEFADKQGSFYDDRLMDYGDSPSATSAISNSNVAKFDSRFFGNLPLGPHSVKFPAKSNIVVRLMGKEITVNEKDYNPLPQLQPSHLPMMNSQGNPRSCTVSDAYLGDVQNNRPVVSQGLVLSPMQQNSSTEDVGVTLSSGYNNCYYGAPQTPSWHVNPTQGYHQANTSSPYGGLLPPLQSPNLRTPPSSEVSSSHTMWNCVPYLQNGSFTIFTPPTYI